MKSHNDLLSGSERRAKENRNKCRRPSEASYAGFSLARSGEPDNQGITESTEPGQKPASYPPAIPEAPCTLPLGVLQAGNVSFLPAFSTAKQTAISRMGMGTLDKVTMRFNRRFGRQRRIGF
jgi:hypothetical protein